MHCLWTFVQLVLQFIMARISYMCSCWILYYIFGLQLKQTQINILIVVLLDKYLSWVAQLFTTPKTLWCFHVWSQDDTVLYNSSCSTQYVDCVLCGFKDGDNPQTSLPTTYCICSSDYIHKMKNKTTAYGTSDSLQHAIWGPLSSLPSIPPPL